MRRSAILIAVAACALLAGCNSEGNNYRQASNPPGQNPPGQNPNGTPADRTGGARNVPDGAGPVRTAQQPPKK